MFVGVHHETKIHTHIHGIHTCHKTVAMYSLNNVNFPIRSRYKLISPVLVQQYYMSLSYEINNDSRNCP